MKSSVLKVKSLKSRPFIKIPHMEGPEPTQTHIDPDPGLQVRSFNDAVKFPVADGQAIGSGFKSFVATVKSGLAGPTKILGGSPFEMGSEACRESLRASSNEPLPDDSDVPDGVRRAQVDFEQSDSVIRDLSLTPRSPCDAHSFDSTPERVTSVDAGCTPYHRFSFPKPRLHSSPISALTRDILSPHLPKSEYSRRIKAIWYALARYVFVMSQVLYTMHWTDGCCPTILGINRLPAHLHKFDSNSPSLWFQ